MATCAIYLASGIVSCLTLVTLALCCPLTALGQEQASSQQKVVETRFIDHGDYVEDTQTRLFWQKDGASSGKRNFYDAGTYARKLRLGGSRGWRVPTAKELASIFPADSAPFTNSAYNKDKCCGGPNEFRNYWTSELDTRTGDYAYVYHWYAKGGANNCIASMAFVYVRCVRDASPKIELVEIDEDTRKTVMELITLLGSENFAEREQATDELKTYGPKILALLDQAVEMSRDPEVKFRLNKLISHMSD
jgi:hypothetical protein